MGKATSAKNIEDLFNTEGRALLTRFAPISAIWRCLGSVLLVVIASPLIAHGEVLAQKEASVDLSPLVAKSTVTAHTDSAKEISVVFVLPLSNAKVAADYAAVAITRD